MNTLIVTLVSLTVVGIGANPLDWRIIGGSEAEEGQYPFMVSLRFDDPFNGDMHMCGGTIINCRCIVTAAHCVFGDPANFYIKAGTNSLSEPGVIYEIESIIAHKNFEPVNITDDIAIIRVTTDIKFIKNKISYLPLNTEPLKGGEQVVFGGWGSTKAWAPPPDRLQCMSASVVPQDECQRLQRPYPVTEGMICTYAGKGHGACHGDSGSFLMGNGELVGIVSWGRPCAIGFPDVFTRVSSYINWIHEHMKDINC